MGNSTENLNVGKSFLPPPCQKAGVGNHHKSTSNSNPKRTLNLKYLNLIPKRNSWQLA